MLQHTVPVGTPAPSWETLGACVHIMIISELLGGTPSPGPKMAMRALAERANSLSTQAAPLAEPLLPRDVSVGVRAKCSE